MTEAAIFSDISKKFGETTVLEDINFEVAEGEIVVLLGASGSGKTTILRIIAGLENANSGKIILHGKDVTELPARERGSWSAWPGPLPCERRQELLAPFQRRIPPCLFRHPQ